MDCFQSFPEPVVYNSQTGYFELPSDNIRASLASDLRNALRLRKKRGSVYDVTSRHSFSPVQTIDIEHEPAVVLRLKTTYTVQVQLVLQ